MVKKITIILILSALLPLASCAADGPGDPAVDSTVYYNGYTGLELAVRDVWIIPEGGINRKNLTLTPGESSALSDLDINENYYGGMIMPLVFIRNIEQGEETDTGTAVMNIICEQNPALGSIEEYAESIYGELLLEIGEFYSELTAEGAASVGGLDFVRKTVETYYLFENQTVVTDFYFTEIEYFYLSILIRYFDGDSASEEAARDFLEAVSFSSP